MRIVVDAMGGDHAPEVVVAGAVRAARELNVGVTLVGPRERILKLAVGAAGSHAGLRALDVEVEDAQQVVAMDELPLPALKQKKQSSILVGLRLVRDGRGQAFFSAGNTGAVMAGATIVLRRLKGVERAALAATLPTRRGNCVLLDVGANLEVRPQHLEQFAVMGSCFFQAERGVASPRVALLSVGEEEVKGSDLVRRVHQDLKAGPVNFVGNVDGKDVFSGEVDVIVTDGFTGNAILKSNESLLTNLTDLARERVKGSLRARLGYLLLRPLLRDLKRKLDHDEYGAVPLLGISRPVFIGHGASSERSVFSAIRAVRIFVAENVNETIQSQLRELASSAGDDRAPARPVGDEVVRAGGGDR